MYLLGKILNTLVVHCPTLYCLLFLYLELIRYYTICKHKILRSSSEIKRCTKTSVGEVARRSNIDWLWALQLGNEQLWPKGGVCKNLSWLVDQTKVFKCGCRTAMVYANILGSRLGLIYQAKTWCTNIQSKQPWLQAQAPKGKNLIGDDTKRSFHVTRVLL
jgi:hypothetical protein